MSSAPGGGCERNSAIEARAAAWLVERDGGMSADDAAAFARWRNEDPRHEAAVARLENTWNVLQELKGYRPGAQIHPDRDLLARPRRSRPVKRFRMPALASAATLIVLLLLVSQWWQTRSNTHKAIYTTTAAGYERVLLADGSVLELHAQTEAHVRFTDVERRVNLVHGEAHFTVAKDTGRPFRVQAGDITVRAVGTAFNVLRTSLEVVVLVTQGRVKIDQLTAPEAVQAPTVAAGERAVIPVAEARPSTPVRVRPIRVEKIDADAMREALAWQGPRLVFLETPLSQVVSEFNRHNRLQLVLGDAELETIAIAGSFRADGVDAFVRLIASDNNVVTEQVSPNQIVLRKAPLHPPHR